jgi:hypothetical protein
MESVPLGLRRIQDATASEIARVIKPGGKVYIKNTNTPIGKQIADAVVKALRDAKKAPDVKQETVTEDGVDTLKTYITVGKE